MHCILDPDDLPSLKHPNFNPLDQNDLLQHLLSSFLHGFCWLLCLFLTLVKLKFIISQTIIILWDMIFVSFYNYCNTIRSIHF